MEVVLSQDVKGYGVRGNKISVSDGYAINFLIKKGLAVDANSNEGKILFNKQEDNIYKVEENDKNIENTITNLPDTVQIKLKTNDMGKLFQAITPQILKEEFSKLGFSVNEDLFSFIPIKHVGEHDVLLSYKKIRKNIKVTVLKN